MKIERSMRNGVSATELFEMMCTTQYQERKCEDAGALSYRVSVERDGDTARITARRTLPSTGFPGLLRKLVPSGVTSTETVHWGPAAADGARTGALAVEFHGSPAALTGTIRILPDGPDATVVVVDAEFKAHIPLVGGKVESFAAPIILGVIDAEERTGQAWVAGVR